jgi:hypothetical protein
MELDVAVVLRLAADRRDCGRRIPVFTVLWARKLTLLPPNVGDAAEVEAIGRKAVGAIGLEAFRLSISSSFSGEESSIMSTQPDVSMGCDFFFSVSISRLCLDRISLLGRSLATLSLVDALLEDREAVPDEGDIADVVRLFAF